MFAGSTGDVFILNSGELHSYFSSASRPLTS